MFKKLGAVFASLFGLFASGAAVPPANAPHTDQPAPERQSTYGVSLFPPMRYHGARRNPAPGDGRGHYIEHPHPVVPAPLARMSRLGREAELLAKPGAKDRDGKALSGKALRRRLSVVQHAISVVANEIGGHEKRLQRRAA